MAPEAGRQFWRPRTRRGLGCGVPAGPGNEYASTLRLWWCTRSIETLLHLAPTTRERHEVRALPNRRLLRRDVRRGRSSRARPPRALVQFIDDAARRRAAAPAAGGRARAAATWASPSTSTATAPARRRSSRSTSCRASSPAAEWSRIERGLKQRIHALNLFIDDVYHEQKIVKDGVVPGATSSSRRKRFREAVRRAEPAARHLVPHHGHRPRARTATARSTCSRTTCAARPASPTCSRTAHVMKRTFPQVFEPSRIRPVDDYPEPAARHAGVPGARRTSTSPRVRACSRPGIYNSAYFEHSFLAQQMGVELVEGRDLVVVGRLRLHADDEGLRARRRDLPPHRRRLPRSRDVPARLDAGRARPDGRLPGRAASRWPTRRAPASPTTRSSTPTCRRS